jgi:hypothetical protein
MKCRTCSEPITWLRSSSGKAHAVAPETVRDGDTLFIQGVHKVHVCAPARSGISAQADLFDARTRGRG